jgi:hypothetical protein
MTHSGKTSPSIKFRIIRPSPRGSWVATWSLKGTRQLRLKSPFMDDFPSPHRRSVVRFPPRRPASKRSSRDYPVSVAFRTAFREFPVAMQTQTENHCHTPRSAYLFPTPGVHALATSAVPESACPLQSPVDRKPLSYAQIRVPFPKPRRSRLGKQIQKMIPPFPSSPLQGARSRPSSQLQPSTEPDAPQSPPFRRGKHQEFPFPFDQLAPHATISLSAGQSNLLSVIPLWSDVNF